MRDKISIYGQFPAEHGVIRLSLAESFNTRSMPIRSVQATDIFDGSALGPDTVLVLPGAPHGDGYRAQLGGDGFARIKEHVQDGGGLLLICASTYLASKTYSYDRDDGTTAQFVSDFALLDAHAHGPIPELSDPGKRWGGTLARHDVAMLNVFCLEGVEHEVGVCYSKGPRLHVSPDETCDIIARFRDIAGQPPAIVGKTIGKGYAVFSSVSLDVSGSQMKDRIRPVNAQLADAKRFAEALAELERSRNHLWDGVWTKLKNTPGQVRAFAF
jgi:glutamine amidotransferase-like uncharacterized protein